MCDAEEELKEVQAELYALKKKYEGEEDENGLRGEIQDLLCGGCDREPCLRHEIRWPCMDCKTHRPRR